MAEPIADETAGEEDPAWCQMLRDNLSDFETRLRAFRVEFRAKKKLTQRAKEGRLRAGRYRTVKNEKGQIVDLGAMYENQLNARLAQLEFEIETMEITIEETQAELAAQPQAEDKTETA